MRRQETSVGSTGEGVDYDRESTTKKIARWSGRLATKGAVFLTLGIASGVALSTVVPTEVPFGPGTARATATFDGSATLDGGVIGSVQKDIDGPSLGPIHLGVSLRANELPIQEPNPETTEIDQLSVSQIFGEIDGSDIHRFGEYSRASTAQASEITDSLRDHALSMGSLVGTIALVFYELPGKKGRKHVKETLKRPQIYLPLVVALYLGQANIPDQPSYSWQETSSDYDDTPLEGVRVSGEVADRFINVYGRRIMNYIRRTDEFYNQALANARDTVAGDVLLGQRPEDQQNFTFLFFTDNHCNTGTPQIMAYIASEAGVNTAIDGGDTVFSGTGYERYCVQQEMEPFNEAGIEVGAVQGNHDSDTTAHFMEQFGAHMLSGEVETINGVRFIGDTDTSQSPFGHGIQPRGDRTLESLGQDLSNAACSAEGPSILVVHRERAAMQALREGCVYLSLSGHTHEQELFFTDWAENYSSSNPGAPYVQITGGSSGGAMEHTETYGRLRNPSVFMLLSVGPNNKLKYYQSISIDTHGFLRVGAIEENKYYSD